MRAPFPFFFTILAIFSALPSHAQNSESRPEQNPTWWFGVAGAANLNFYEGTTQQLNGGLITPVPFHKGSGIGPYVAAALEYRPDPVWGGMLQIGYDDRRGTFDDVTCPCGTLSLKARPAYLSIEPSLRWSPFAGDLHVFAGPRLGFLWSPLHDEKSFNYARTGTPSTQGAFSAMRRVVYSGQIGAGYDLEWTDWFESKGANRIQLSPFVSYQPHFGQDPRDTDHDKEWWALSTVRIGAVLKFGRGKPAVVAPDVRFSVQAPPTVVTSRRIHETFPLRNYIYFGGDSLEFSGRYTRLDPVRAAAFREPQLQDSFPAAPTGRSLRQMAVYHHILNILGDRLRRNPGTTLTLVGLSGRQGPRYGIARAEEVKRYLTRAFGIDGDRIATGEREEPAPPLGRNATELEMLRDENQRVDILSTSPEMLVQVGESEHFMLKPVEIEGEAPGNDSVVFTTARARLVQLLKPASGPFVWSLEITDDSDPVPTVRRFGPFTRARETLPAALLLGNRPRAQFTAVMTGREEGKTPGAPVTRRAGFRLSQRNGGIHESLRFGILFDIDQARAVSSYEKFLSEVVAPRITDTSAVFIRGRTDVIAETPYNLRLSKGRAEGVWRSLENAARRDGRLGVRFLPAWSGEDPSQAPFGNVFPEERNYNRTVIIDIVPEE